MIDLNLILYIIRDNTTTKKKATMALLEKVIIINTDCRDKKNNLDSLVKTALLNGMIDNSKNAV